MRSNHYIPLMVLSLLILTTSVTYAKWEDWREFHTKYETSGSDFIRIEVKTYQSKNWKPKARWRVVNNTRRTLYCVTQGPRVYRLSTGVDVKVGLDGGEGCYTIKPGSSRAFTSDLIGNKDGARIKQFTVSYIEYKESPKGKTTRLKFADSFLGLPYPDRY